MLNLMSISGLSRRNAVTAATQAARGAGADVLALITRVRGQAGAKVASANATTHATRPTGRMTTPTAPCRAGCRSPGAPRGLHRSVAVWPRSVTVTAAGT